jgi:hypothetical protein
MATLCHTETAVLNHCLDIEAECSADTAAVVLWKKNDFETALWNTAHEHDAAAAALCEQILPPPRLCVDPMDISVWCMQQNTQFHWETALVLFDESNPHRETVPVDPADNL